ncbi:pyridoxamine 5'-phosphate oxidase family protein [Nocardioides plantarum]|uniref:Pyridoxamine 5'-phosphate oxidase family protein n=1 Tax=Nocardioides plantarum TaxID=29299 RepID=A0ABV5K7K7_9ACTN|nr:pyridoxamine 5'-phosphate oxidase family protein [Nocardioides plantarum]
MNDLGTVASSELLTPEECLGLLSASIVGRVAFVGPHGLVLRPVNYRVVDGTVLFRSSSAGALGDLVGHRDGVVFEVDHHAALAPTGWSVLVRGACSVVSDPAVLASPGLEALVVWASDATDLVLAIQPDEVTGRRVGVHRRSEASGRTSQVDRVDAPCRGCRVRRSVAT